MSNTNSISTVKMTKIAFRFDLDGSIVPCLDIQPPIPLGNNQYLSRISIEHPLSEISSLAVGDTLEVEITPEQTYITILELGTSKRYDFSQCLCPVCHSGLVPGFTGIGRCFNRDCPAQMSYTSILFLSSLGFALHYPIKKVLDSLLVRGLIDKLSRIFQLSEDEIVCASVSNLEAQTFLHYIHSARTRIQMVPLLQAIRVPDLTDDWINGLDKYMKSQNQSFLTHLDKYLSMREQEKTDLHPQGWIAWNVFFSIPNNKRLLQEMLHYLQPR